MLFFCIAGFSFGIYYSDDINNYLQTAEQGKDTDGLLKSFFNFYYDSAKLQILIFICSFTIFCAPVGVVIVLYSSILLGSSAIVITDINASSNCYTYLIVFLYTFSGAVSLYLYIEMINRAYRYSISASHYTISEKISLSRNTRCFISYYFSLSVLILAAEICRFFIITVLY